MNILCKNLKRAVAPMQCVLILAALLTSALHTCNTAAEDGANTLQIAPNAVLHGQVGVPFSASLATGGLPPYTIGCNLDGFPPELEINPVDATIGGTPATAAGYLACVQVTDSAGATVGGEFILIVSDGEDDWAFLDNPSTNIFAEIAAAVTEALTGLGDDEKAVSAIPLIASQIAEAMMNTGLGGADDKVVSLTALVNQIMAGAVAGFSEADAPPDTLIAGFHGLPWWPLNFANPYFGAPSMYGESGNPVGDSYRRPSLPGVRPPPFYNNPGGQTAPVPIQQIPEPVQQSPQTRPPPVPFLQPTRPPLTWGQTIRNVGYNFFLFNLLVQSVAVPIEGVIASGQASSAREAFIQTGIRFYMRQGMNAEQARAAAEAEFQRLQDQYNRANGFTGFGGALSQLWHHNMFNPSGPNFIAR